MMTAPSISRVRHMVRQVDSQGYELLASLMLINLYDPLEISWQPVTDLLKRLDNVGRLLERDFAKALGQNDLPPDLVEARVVATGIMGRLNKELIALTKLSQLERVEPKKFDTIAIFLRRDVRPAVDDLCLALEQFEKGQA